MKRRPRVKSIHSTDDSENSICAVDEINVNEIDNILSEETICIMDNSQDLIAVHELESGEYIKVSNSFYEITQYNYDELIGNSPYNFFHAEDIENIKKSHTQVIEEAKERHAITYRFRRKDGVYLWFETSTQRAKDYIITSTRDVSERMKLEAENQRLAETMRFILENLEDYIFFKNKTDTFCHACSSSVTRDLGYSPEELKKIPVQDLVSHNTHKCAGEMHGRLPDGTYQFNCKDRSVTTLSTHSYIFNGELEIVVARNMTQEFEKNEIEKNLAVEKMERKKDLEAAQIFSHECKNGFLTSVSAINILVDTLAPHTITLQEHWGYINDLLGELKTRTKKGVEICMNEAMWRSLLHGTYTVSHDEVQLGTWADSLTGHNLQLYIPYFLREKRTKFDKALVETIISNALTNATKYGSKTDVPKMILQQPKSGKTIHIIIRNSPGENHEKILERIYGGWDPDSLFDKSRRLDENSNEKMEKISSGHGLWVSRLAANEMGAEVKIAFDAYHCEFTLILPCRAHFNLGKIEMPEISMAILDDDRIERMTLQRLFNISNFRWIRELHVKGKTPDEALRFPQFIIDNKIDIALFDENLFDDIQGSDLMIEARKGGFKGLMVSRSSMDILGGLGILNRVCDGFLPKCVDSIEDITSKLYDIIVFNKQQKIAGDEMGAISSISASNDGSLDALIDLEHYENAGIQICELPEMLNKLLEASRRFQAELKYINELLNVFIIAKEEITILLKRASKISSPCSHDRCSSSSSRPWRTVHQLKGISINLGFKRVEDYTTRLCKLGNDLDRDILDAHIGHLNLLFIQAFAHIDGMLGYDKKLCLDI